MTFFYDLNKRLADLASKQDAQHLAEHATPAAQQPKKGSLAQALNERDMGKHNNKTTGFDALAKKAGKEYGSKAAGERVAGAQFQKMKKAGKLEEKEVDESAVRIMAKPEGSQVTRGTAAYVPKNSIAGKTPQGQAHRDATAAMAKSARAAGGKLAMNKTTDATGKRVPGGYDALAKGVTPYRSSTEEGNAFTGALAKTPKGGTFKVGGKEFKDTSNLEEGHCPACDCSPCECDTMEESAFQAAIGKKKYGDAGMKALQKAGREHASDKTMSNIRNRYDKYDESQGMTDEGNAFSKAVVDAKRDGIQKGEKIRVGGKELPLKELDMRLLKGAQGSMKGSNTDSESERNKHKKYGYRSDRDDTGNDDDYDEHGNLKNKKKAAASDGPKKKGRPTKEKQPERVTAKSYKYKSGRPTKTKEGLDSDGVMMTRPTNMSSEGVSPAEQGEYNDEAGMTKDSLHTIVRHARELEKCLRQNENLPEWVQEKVGQIKGMMSSVTDYILSTHERDAEQHLGREGITIVPESANFSGGEIQQAYRLAVALKMFITDPDGKKAQADLVKLLKYKLMQSNDTLGPANTIEEKAVSQAQRRAAGIAHAAQKGEIPKSRLRGASKEMAQMPQGELHKFAATKEKGLPKKVKEESTDREDQRAEKAGRRVAKDIEYDEGHKAKGDNKAERAGKRVTKDIEYDDKKDRKEKKVDETTVSGSVATAAPSGKPSKGMQFGKGVYESLDRQFKQALTESISIESKMQECGDGEMAPAITITADGEEAAKLMMLLKLAGLESQIPKACPSCGASPCGCDQMVDENAPDWPTNTDTLAADPNLRTYSGGLNGPKSTGQSTTPVLASQLRRQASMEESVALERNLFKTWQNYKG